MNKKINAIMLILFGGLLFSCSAENNVGGGVSGGATEGTNNNVVVETTRKIFYTVEYNISCEDYNEIKNNISKKVDDYDGYIQSSTDSTNYSEYVYRIPTEDLNSFLDYVDSYEEVSYKNVTSTDITSSYSQTEARIEVLENSRNSYLKILQDNSLSMQEIIQIQNKIDEIDSELLSLKNQMSYFDNLLDYSKVTIRYGKIYQEPSFFREYGQYFVDVFVGFGKFILYLIPFAILASPFVVLVVILNKRKKKINNK